MAWQDKNRLENGTSQTHYQIFCHCCAMDSFPELDSGLKEGQPVLSLTKGRNDGE